MPQGKAVVEAGVAVVLGQPELEGAELLQIEAEIAHLLVEVYRRGVARLGDPLAEGGGALGEHLVLQLVGAGPFGKGDGLPVIDHGAGDGVALQQREGIVGLLPGLLRGDGLGEEVHPHVQPRI